MAYIVDTLASAVQAASRTTMLSALGLALIGVPGWAGAVGTDQATPVRPGRDAPGMIRTDTCERPVYPQQELEPAQQGIVTLRLLLGVDGKIRKLAIAQSSGHPALDKATALAISQCSFYPPMADGRPVEAWVHFQYDWKP